MQGGSHSQDFPKTTLHAAPRKSDRLWGSALFKEKVVGIMDCSDVIEPDGKLTVERL